MVFFYSRLMYSELPSTGLPTMYAILRWASARFIDYDDDDDQDDGQDDDDQ